MIVQAKFKVESITQFEQNKNVKFRAVTATSEENKSFSKYTPYGEITMNIDKETGAYDYFKVGKEYYVNFMEATEE